MVLSRATHSHAHAHAPTKYAIVTRWTSSASRGAAPLPARSALRLEMCSKLVRAHTSIPPTRAYRSTHPYLHISTSVNTHVRTHKRARTRAHTHTHTHARAHTTLHLARPHFCANGCSPSHVVARADPGWLFHHVRCVWALMLVVCTVSTASNPPVQMPPRACHRAPA